MLDASFEESRMFGSRSSKRILVFVITARASFFRRSPSIVLSGVQKHNVASIANARSRLVGELSCRKKLLDQTPNGIIQHDRKKAMACSPKCARALRWIIFGLSILAWVFSVVVTVSCDFLTATRTSSLAFYDSTEQGPFCFKLDSEKFFWKDQTEDPDSGIKASQAFGILNCIALSFCFVGVFLMIFVLRDKASRMVWLATRILFCLALAFSLAIFSYYEGVISDCKTFEEIGYSCSGGSGAIVHAILVIAQVALVIMAFMTPIPPSPVIKCDGCCCCADLEEGTRDDQKIADP